MNYPCTALFANIKQHTTSNPTCSLLRTVAAASNVDPTKNNQYYVLKRIPGMRWDVPSSTVEWPLKSIVSLQCTNRSYRVSCLICFPRPSRVVQPLSTNDVTITSTDHFAVTGWFAHSCIKIMHYHMYNISFLSSQKRNMAGVGY